MDIYERPRPHTQGPEETVRMKNALLQSRAATPEPVPAVLLNEAAFGHGVGIIERVVTDAQINVEQAGAAIVASNQRAEGCAYLDGMIVGELVGQKVGRDIGFLQVLKIARQFLFESAKNGVRLLLGPHGPRNQQERTHQELRFHEIHLGCREGKEYYG